MTEQGLAGHVALVSGGTSGIGLAISHRLVEDGAAVVVLGRDPEIGAQAEAELQESGRARFVAADVRSPEAVSEAFAVAEETFGVPDLVVAAAGVGVVAPLLETSEEDWRWTWETNVGGCLFLCQAAMRRLRALDRPGSVVLIGSDAGVVGERSIGAYSVSKAAVAMMGRVLALDGAGHWIRVNCVCPGYVTPGMRHMPDRAHVAAGESGAGYVDPPLPPLGRYGAGGDIASSVRFLLGEESAFITGAVLMVEGGATAGLP